MSTKADGRVVREGVHAGYAPERRERRSIRPVLLRVDVPYDGPQVLAYRAPADGVRALREALRIAFEHGDGTPLRQQWRRHIDGYRAERAATWWRVPRATLLELVDELRKACARAEQEGDPDGGDSLEPECRAALRAECDRWSEIAERAPCVDLAPDRWLPFITSCRFRARPYARGHAQRRPLAYEWERWASVLAELDRPHGSRDPDSYMEHDGESAPPGTLEVFRDVRYYLETFDPDTDESVRGPEISADELQNPMRDPVVLGDGTETVLMHAWDRALAMMRCRSHLELLVGPFVPSRGPGPFMPRASVAKGIVDSGWLFLDVFRHLPRAGFAPGWLVIEPEDIASALDEIPDEPTRELEEEVGGEHERELWGTAKAPDWIEWEDAVRQWWPRCRERYVALLEEAQRAGDCVVMAGEAPDDQGTISTPLADDLGVRVRLEEG
jgi:hypothetical protein